MPPPINQRRSSPFSDRDRAIDLLGQSALEASPISWSIIQANLSFPFDGNGLSDILSIPGPCR